MDGDANLDGDGEDGDGPLGGGGDGLLGGKGSGLVEILASSGGCSSSFDPWACLFGQVASPICSLESRSKNLKKIKTI